VAPSMEMYDPSSELRAGRGLKSKSAERDWVVFIPENYQGEFGKELSPNTNRLSEHEL